MISELDEKIKEAMKEKEFVKKIETVQHNMKKAEPHVRKMIAKTQKQPIK